MLDLNRPVQTRCGYDARIILTDLKSTYPLVYAVMIKGKEYLQLSNLDGTSRSGQVLVNTPEKYTRYVNVYKVDGQEPTCSEPYFSRAVAVQCIKPGNYIKTIEVTFTI